MSSISETKLDPILESDDSIKGMFSVLLCLSLFGCFGDVASAQLKPFPLWDETVSVPKASELSQLDGVEFHVIKMWEPDVDDYKWLHGVALAWHRGKLFASYGHNKGAENTAGEMAHYQVSDDAGKSWSRVMTIDAGTDSPDLAISHGVFLSHDEKLWAFHGAFYGRMERIHTRAYLLDDQTQSWQKRGIVLEDGFWPMTEPVRMSDGNWIMPGLLGGVPSSKRTFPAAVAISSGEDFTKWHLVKIPTQKDLRMWGESSLIVKDNRILNIARYGGKAEALVALSQDFGRSWSPSTPANLPMVTSQPCAGRLSSGQSYLLCTTTADSGGRRSPLTIAVSRPGQEKLSRVFQIRDAVFPAGTGESHPQAGLAYPYAIERDGNLYVGYSNNGGRKANQNSGELAIIPVKGLQIGD